MPVPSEPSFAETAMPANFVQVAGLLCDRTFPSRRPATILYALRGPHGSSKYTIASAPRCQTATLPNAPSLGGFARKLCAVAEFHGPTWPIGLSLISNRSPDLPIVST